MHALILLSASVWGKYAERTFVKGLGEGLSDILCISSGTSRERTDYTPWPGDLRRKDRQYLEYYARALVRGFHGIHQGENLPNAPHRLLAAESTGFTDMGATMLSAENVL